MSDFSDRPLVAGSLTGLRSFRVDSLGRLTGYTHRTVFLPGENVGACLRNEFEDVWSTYMYPSRVFSGTFTRSLSLGGTFFPSQEPPYGVETQKAVEAAAAKAHQVGQLDCGCGFYAYFDGTNQYHKTDEVQLAGIIEGYGVVTVGQRGFRSEKARLVALIVPDKASPAKARLFDRVRHNYPDVPAYSKKRAALAAHPLTEPDPISPETDEDFWTRSA